MKLPQVSWSALSKFHAIAAIRTTYVWVIVVPVLAKALEDVGGRVHLTVFGAPIDVTLELPFSWIVFYFSALSFAAAEVLYYLRCPRVVREQSTYKQFREEGKGVEHLDDYIFEVDMNWEGLRQAIEQRDDYFGEVAQAGNPRQDDGLLRKRFWTVYHRGDRFRVWSRLLCAILYGIGVALIVYVAAQNLEYVVRYLVAH